MSLVSARAIPAVAAASAALFNEGLVPGARVILDEQPQQTATVRFAETDAAFAQIRLERTGERLRVSSWRLTLLD